MILGNRRSALKKTNVLDKNILEKFYGADSFDFTLKKSNSIFVCSKLKELDLIELDQLLQTVGWSRRPIRRVKRALQFSILVVGLWKHDEKFPRLVGFARCTGDGVIDATIWDVAINPVYQGYGLGKQLMSYLMKSLKRKGISRVTLFADSDVITFYKRQGWDLEPKGNKCAFWYSN